jgi:hypothetical protein
MNIKLTVPATRPDINTPFFFVRKFLAHAQYAKQQSLCGDGGNTMF